ncbi:hypothetical protein FACS1894166_05110 [Bacilli bacterium]|nr:hypothetical protein FACS1894166_05110 [Bacilli bacterium]
MLRMRMKLNDSETNRYSKSVKTVTDQQKLKEFNQKLDFTRKNKMRLDDK